MNQYMIDFQIDENPDERFFSLIPAQRAYINKMMEKGLIISYSLNETRTRLWCIVNAPDAKTVKRLIAAFPLIDYLHPEIIPLMFHNSIVVPIPKFSLN